MLRITVRIKNRFFVHQAKSYEHENSIFVVVFHDKFL